MTKREKLLAAAVATLLVVILSVYGLNRLTAAFDRRHDALLALETEVANQEQVIQAGRIARRKMDEYLKRSLPGNRARARSLYQNWLLEGANEAGFSRVNVSPLAPRAHAELYFRHSFLVTGRGGLEQLVQFLYEFHNVGYLHRIVRIGAKPIGDSNQLDLSVTVEALSLSEAPVQDELQESPAQRLAQKDIEPYMETIVTRNFFSRPNNPPQLAALNPPTAHPGRTVSLQAEASDPDESDRLTYSLVEDAAPDGAQIDPRTGQFQWTPPELGEFEVAVRVTDSGLPPKSDVQKFKISVTEPESEPSGFDPATQAFVSGITIDTGGRREVWVDLRTEGKTLKLAEGDRLEVGTVEGVIQEIGRKEATIETADGKSRILALGKSLIPET